MGRHLAAAVVVVIAGALTAPASAPAKEISRVAVCGPSAQCTTYDGSDFESLMFLAHDAGPTDPPGEAAAWYRVRFTVDEREHGGGLESWTVAYAPSADSLGVRGEGSEIDWVALRPRTAAALRRAARDLPAFPKARLRGWQARPPEERVDEVVNFGAPAPTATRDGVGSGTAPWDWIAAGALATALLVLTVVVLHRRRRHVPVMPT